MIAYYSTFSILLVFRVVGAASYQIRVVLYWAAILGLFIFSGFRLEVGCDWYGYLNNFERFWGYSVREAILLREPAHWGLIAVIQYFELSYTYLNVATSALFFFGIHWMARRQPDPLAFIVLAFPVLILNIPMSGIRQGVAIGFICLAFVAFIDKKLFRFALSVLIGSLFHSSVLVFLLLVPFVFGRPSFKSAALAILLATPGAILMMNSNSAEIASSRYINAGNDAFGAAFRLSLLSLTGVAFFTFLSSKWRERFPKDHMLAFWGSILMIAFFGLLFVSSVIADRFGYYLIPIQLMIAARLPYFAYKNYRMLIIVLPYAILILLFLVWTQFSNNFEFCYVPYQIGIHDFIY